MNTEIYVENYKLDITSGIDALMTFAIDDIKDFGARNTSFSKTIVVPGTQNNNKVFGNVFDIGQANTTSDGGINVNTNYNIAKSAKCIIFQGNMQIFKGIIRIMQIVIDKDNIEYECAVFGELGGLISALGNKKLSDLDLSIYNHQYSIANITSSWTLSRNIPYTTGIGGLTFANNILIIHEINLYQIEASDTITISGTASNNGTYTIVSSQYDALNNYTYTKITSTFPSNVNTSGTITINNKVGFGYCYPMIDYGTYSTAKVDWIYKTFRPALFVNELLILILNYAGYNYSSAFTKTALFRRLIMPYNQKLFQRKSSTDVIVATDTTTQTASVTNSSLYQLIAWNTPTTLANFTINGAKTIYTYSGANATSLKLTFSFLGTWTKSLSQDGVGIVVKKNNSIISYTEVSYPGSQSGTFEFNKNITTSLVTNDTISISIFLSGTASISVASGTLNAKFDPPSYAEYLINENVVMADAIPSNILQKDFLSSLMKMFNLYLYEDKTTANLIKIEPYIDYYDKTIANAKDWTYKVDQSKPMIIKPMSELNARYYKFKYKDDSDFYNEQYRKRYNLSYGSKIFDTEYEFAKDDTNVEVIFSGTPLVGYDTNQKVYSTIFKKSGTTEETIDSNIRILQAKNKTGVNNWYIKATDGTTNLGGAYTSYLYAGHYDDPLLPTIDINFGTPSELFYNLTAGTLTNTLFNVYWLPYMYEIIDETSRLLICNVRLNEIDIQQLDFSKLIYINGIVYRLNKIIDYNASSRDVCKVELLKVINTNY